MFRKRRTTHTTHHRTTRRGLFDFMRKPAFQLGLVLVAVVVILILAVSGQPTTVVIPTPALAQALATPAGLPAEISAEQAYQLYQNNGAYFLDVRERTEWDQFHIPKTTLLPLGQVAALADKFPKDKPIIVVCATGVRSLQGRDILKQAGLANVSSLAGGLETWRERGYPLQP
jgi:rhodanese-related sulfurtransferase